MRVIYERMLRADKAQQRGLTVNEFLVEELLE